MTWHLNAPGRIYDAGEPTAVYFDTASGDTHLVSAFAAHLIRQLHNCPMSSADLAEGLAIEGPEDNDVLTAAVTSALEELRALDIVSLH